MKMNYRKQYLLASAIQAVVIALLVMLLIAVPIYAEEEPPVNLGGTTMEPTDDPADDPVDDPTGNPADEPTGDPVEEPSEEPTEPPLQLSAVVNVSSLNIREAARSSSRRLGHYSRGALIVILEEKTVNGTPWGRTVHGWISLDYVKPIVPIPESGVVCNTDSPGSLHDMPAGRFTVSGDKKTYNGGALSITIPADWLALEQHFEDNGVSYFRHPTISGCQFRFEPSESAYVYKRTEEEYRKILDATIHSITIEKISGFSCTKVVYSYTTSAGVQKMGIFYDNIDIGVIVYYFDIEYPAAENEQLAPIFEEMIDSIVLLPYSPIG
jgi:hypothetical protein